MNTPEYDSTEAFVSLDFETYFPHKYWLSSWARDEQYPEGFRYKLLSVRSEADDLIQLLVIIEEISGVKSEMTRLDVSSSALDQTAATFTEGLSEEYNIEFTELDLTKVDTEPEFEQLVEAAGWYSITLQ